MKLLKHFTELTLHPKNANELKGLILQLAVHGKLTESWRKENPDIETALILLKLIQKKEQRKTIKDYFLNEDDIPFNIPQSWVWSKLGKLCTVKTGKKDANYGTLDGQYNFYTCAQEPIKSPTFSFQGEAIILPGNGANVGLVTYVNEKFEAYQRTYVLNDFSPIFPLYIKTALEALWKDNLGRQYGSAINYIKIGNITEFKFPIPPLEEQKEIVKVVETLFKEVEQLEQLTVERIGLKEDFVTSALNQLTTNNAKYEWAFLQDHFKSVFNETSNIKKLRETVLQLAVQGKLTSDWRTNNPDTEDATMLLKRIQKEKAQLIKDKIIKKEKPLLPISKDEIPYELPDGWVWCRIVDLTNIQNGYAFKSSKFSKKGVRLVRNVNIGHGEINWKQTALYPVDEIANLEQFKLGLNDILISLDRPLISTGLKITKVAEKDLPSMLLQRIGRVDFSKIKIHIDFLYFWFNSPQFVSSIDQGRSNGVPHISSKDIENRILALPPLEEQKAIVQKVNALLGLCDALEQEVQQSHQQIEKLMQSCLREVFEEK